MHRAVRYRVAVYPTRQRAQSAPMRLGLVKPLLPSPDGPICRVEPGSREVRPAARLADGWEAADVADLGHQGHGGDRPDPTSSAGSCRRAFTSSVGIRLADHQVGQIGIAVGAVLTVANQGRLVARTGQDHSAKGDYHRWSP